MKERARNHPGSLHLVCAGHPCIPLPPHPFGPGVRPRAGKQEGALSREPSAWGKSRFRERPASQRGEGLSHGERPTGSGRPHRPSCLSPPHPGAAPRIRRSPRPRALRRPQAPWFQHLGQRQHGGSAGSGRAPWPFLLRRDERGSGKGTWVRTSPGVLGDPSFICSFIHSTPSPWSRP